MKKILFSIMIFFMSLTMVSAINRARIIINIDEDNNIKKQIIIDNKDKELKVRIPSGGKRPGNLYGYHINIRDISSNVKYDKKDGNVVFNKLKNQDRVVLNYEYDTNFKQNDGYEYFDILDGIDKDIKKLDVQIGFEDDYEIEDLKVFLDRKETRLYTKYVQDNKVSLSFNDVKKDSILSFQVKRDVKNSVSALTILSFVFPIICLIISYVIWYLYGKDKTEVIEKRMNPVRQLQILDVARLYNEKITKSDIISLIFALCDKGFIQIEETKDDLKLVRLKNYTGHSYSEGLLFDAIFIKSYVGTFDEVINKKKKEYNDEVSVKDIKIVRTIDRIMANENAVNKKYEFFERDTNSKKNIIISMAVISLVLITINPFLGINSSIFNILALLIEIVSFYLIYRFINYIDFNKIKKYIAPVLLTILLLILIFAFIFGTNSIYEIAYLIGIICVIAMMILAKYMPKRNPYGNKLFYRMEGFRKLLEDGTKREYQNVINTNDNYYYEIISYLYVFNNKDVVSKRFRGVIDKECDWFKSYKKFEYDNFNKTCDIIFNVLKENN